MRIKVKANNRTLNYFNPKHLVAIDTETTGLNVWNKDEAFMVSMCDEEGNTWCCTWNVNPFTREVIRDKQYFIDVQYIINVLSISSIRVIFHNSKFDVRMLGTCDIEILKLLLHIHSYSGLNDTLFMARVCQTLELTYALKPLSKKYLNIEDEDEKDLQKAVVSARRIAQMYNRKVQKGIVQDKLIALGEDVKEDYWLPYYYEPGNNLCEIYCRLDSFRTMGLYLFYFDIMRNDSYLQNTYRMEMDKIWPIVNYMEARGMRVYPDVVDEESKRCEDAMIKHYNTMQEIIQTQNLKPFAEDKKETDFNPSSSPQLLRVLYLSKEGGGLGLTTDRRNRKTGNVTADKDTLRELMYEPFVRELVGYRNAKQVKGLFFDKIGTMVQPDPLQKNKGLLVRASFNQCGTKTGRFSGGSEGGLNAQQATAGGKKSLGGSTYSSQKVFGPRDDSVWLGFDYSQQEARLFAWLANVPVMLNAMKSGDDMFKAMANKAWGGKGNPDSVNAVIQALGLYKSKDEVTPLVNKVRQSMGWGSKYNPTDYTSGAFEGITEEWLSRFDYNIVKAEASIEQEYARQRSKHITYAKIFGGGPGSYTHLLYCTLEQAKTFDKTYNESMPELKQYIKEIESQARKDGFIVTAYGRKLRVEPNFAYRGVSYMIQGTAAGMMKESLIKVHNFNKRIKLDAHIILTIHDELKVEIKKSDYNLGYVRAVASLMEDTEGKVEVHIPVECTLCEKQWSIDEQKIKIWD